MDKIEVAKTYARFNALEHLIHSTHSRWQQTAMGSDTANAVATELKSIGDATTAELLKLLEAAAKIAPRRFRRALRLGHGVTELDAGRLIGSSDLSEEAVDAARAIAAYLDSTSIHARAVAAALAARSLGHNCDLIEAWTSEERSAHESGRNEIMTSWATS